MAELTTILEDLLGDPQFLYALGAGALILLAFYVARRAFSVRPRGWALLYGAMVLAVLGLVFTLESSLVSCLALVAGAGVIVDLTGRLSVRRWRIMAQSVSWSLVALCLALFTTQVSTGQEPWVPITLLLWTLALAGGTRALDRSPLAAILAPLLAVTVVGIYVTVPETDMVEAILGASVTMALVTLPPINARATTSGLLLVACLLGWLTVDGAAHRDIALIGGLISAGVLLLGPLVTVTRRDLRPAWVFGVHVVFVIVATRLVDWIPSLTTLLIALAILILLAVAALAALGGEQPAPP